MSIFLTPEQRVTFGITSEAQEEEIYNWNMARIGVTLSSRGRGGSGVFVQLKSKKIALLTARHVVLPGVLSGELTLSHAGRGQSFLPSAIHMDSRLDLAYLVIPDEIEIKSYLTQEEWAPEGQPQIPKGMAVVACGVPGLLKSTPDVAARTIKKTVFMQYWTGVLEPSDQDGWIVCDINKADPQLPKSFQGMSGGPVFSNKKELIGINVLESLGPSTHGRLYVLPRHRFGSLTTPFVPSGNDSPTDYVMCEQGRFSMRAVHKDRPVENLFVTARIEFYKSQGEPEHSKGRMGRIVCLYFAPDPDDMGYPINIEAVFYFKDDSEEEKINAVRRELSSVLRGTKFSLRP